MGSAKNWSPPPPSYEKLIKIFVFVDRAEYLLHDHFGDVNYWGIRRAMKFAPHLGKIFFKDEKIIYFYIQLHFGHLGTYRLSVNCVGS